MWRKGFSSLSVILSRTELHYGLNGTKSIQKQTYEWYNTCRVCIAGTILSIEAIILSDALFCLLISYYNQDTAGR